MSHATIASHRSHPTPSCASLQPAADGCGLVGERLGPVPSVTRAMTGEERMLAACRRQPVDTTPVWFMRQAGRCLAEYRELREKYDILTLAKTPELCTQVTVMPVKELGVDAAVLYADIM